MDDEARDEPEADVPADRSRDAELVRRTLAGDREAFGQLYDLWFDRVFAVCLRIARNREIAAEITQDTFLSAWQNLASLQDADSFGGWLLRIARNASFNRSDREGRSRPVDDRGLAMIESVGASPSSAPVGFGVEERLGQLADPAKVAEDREIADLVWEAAASLGERDAEVLDLQLRFGLAPGEIAQALDLNSNAAYQLCHRTRQRLATAVRARVLWSGPRPACDQLEALLQSAGIHQFDAAAVRVADKHASTCDDCSNRRELRLRPSALFASVPIAAAPLAFKHQAASALEAAGVPMDGSAFARATPASTGPDRGGRSNGSSGTPSERADGRETFPSPEVDDGRSTSGSQRARVAAVVGAAALVLVALIALLVARDEADDTVAAGVGGAAATVGPPSTAAAEAALPGDESSATPRSSSPGPIGEGPIEPGAPPPSVAPTTPTSGPPPPEIELTLTPAEVSSQYVVDEASPRLDWTIAGASSVTLHGAATGQRVVLSNEPTGSLSVCPGQRASTGAGEVCTSEPGSYDFDVVVVGLDGIEYRQHITLVVRPIVIG